MKTTLLAICDRQTDMKKKMRWGVLSKNISEGASQRASKRRNENIVLRHFIFDFILHIIKYFFKFISQLYML